ncbi:hypothetical protein NE237_027613 [Protea cynaroides]|uniref:Flavin-containing monooxygenase n=1 Tax=Protea cynaroides TaxID=273540 RepID=A0A9Q0GMV2_9MAGN|nr:hypothetical protein NE237_027613 [Protea cynaroides]
MDEVVLIVGAGPSGLATSACLNLLSVPNLVLEREDCSASLWKKHSYDRLKLHLGKEFCELPHMSFPSHAPNFVPKKGFVEYLDAYAEKFNVNPKYCRTVQSAAYDGVTGKWHVTVKNMVSDEIEEYMCKFLVAATGENGKGIIPKVAGLDSFDGEILHSSEYKNGSSYTGKDVLVVGCGNSGMEVAYDLHDWGARTSMVVRGPVHVFTKEVMYLGMSLLKFLPYTMVDSIMVMLSKCQHGDYSKHGIRTPTEGPFYLKWMEGRAPVIDVGTMEKIENGEIKVVPAISNIHGRTVTFQDGKVQHFDAIIFATGYRSMVRTWLKDGEDLLDQNGVPKPSYPDHWKGKSGLYCAGFARRGLLGIAQDAEKIANDISLAMNNVPNKFVSI